MAVNQARRLDHIVGSKAAPGGLTANVEDEGRLLTGGDGPHDRDGLTRVALPREGGSVLFRSIGPGREAAAFARHVGLIAGGHPPLVRLQRLLDVPRYHQLTQLSPEWFVDPEDLLAAGAP